MVASSPEPEWDELEQQWMLALDAWRDKSICPLCGMDKSICQSAEAEFRVSVPPPTRCHVTTAIRREQAARQAQYGSGGAHEDALLWSATVRD